MANAFLTVLMAVFVLGLIWAALYDTINTTLPTMFPVPIAESNSTWCVLQWIWNISVVAIALSIGIAAMGGQRRNQYGPSVTPPILVGFIVFVCWTTIILLWAAFYNPIFHTIPTAFAAFDPTPAPTYLLTFYNSGCILMTIGLGMGMFARNT